MKDLSWFSLVWPRCFGPVAAQYLKVGSLSSRPLPEGARDLEAQGFSDTYQQQVVDSSPLA